MSQTAMSQVPTSRILLKDRTVIDPEKIECSSGARDFLKYACRLASFDSNINTVAKRFVIAMGNIIAGVATDEELPEKLLANRMEILRSMPEALVAFERTYPDVRLREQWSNWLEITSCMHKVCPLDEKKYSTVTRVAVAWLDARLTRVTTRRIVCPCDLEGFLARFYERRDEIDGTYERLFAGIGDKIEETISKNGELLVRSTDDWMKALTQIADEELLNLGEGSPGVWYQTGEMKVTPTRILATDSKREWTEIYPSDRLSNEATNAEILALAACATSSCWRFSYYSEKEDPQE